MPNNSSEILQASLNAEDALIGSILIESTDGTRGAISQVAGVIKPADFYTEMDRDIFSAMLSCPLPPHQINTARQMLADNTLDTGSISHMSFCISITPCSLDYLDYAESVKRYSEIRTGKKRIIYKGAV